MICYHNEQSDLKLRVKDMEYGYSILMGIFAGLILIYASLMALTKDYKILPLRARVSVQP